MEAMEAKHDISVKELELTKKRLEKKQRKQEMEKRIRNSIIDLWLMFFITIGGVRFVVNSEIECNAECGMIMGPPYVLLFTVVAGLANGAMALASYMRIHSSVDYFLIMNMIDGEKDIGGSERTWFLFKHVWAPVVLVVCMTIAAGLSIGLLTSRVYKVSGQEVVNLLVPS